MIAASSIDKDSDRKLIITWDKVGELSAVLLAFIIPISTSVTNILMGIILICWIGSGQYARKRDILLNHPLVQWVYPLIILSLVGIFYSIGDVEDIRRGLSDSLRLVLIPILIYFYQNKRIAKLALWAFAAAMILTLGLGFLKMYAHLPIGQKFTEAAVFKSHIKTSFFMAISAFFLCLKAKSPSRYRLCFIFVALLMVYYLLFMSAGRIGYITLLVCLILLAWQKARFKGMLLAFFIGAMMLGGAYLTSSVFSQRINILSQDLDFYQGGRLLESSLGSRIAFAKSSLALMREHPIRGWGTGSFGEAYRQAYEHQETLLTDNPHNEYLRMGVEFGLIGIGFLLLLFYQQWQLMKKLEVEYRELFQGILLSFIIGCFLNSWLRDFTEGYFFCVMTAICYASIPSSARRTPLVKATIH